MFLGTLSVCAFISNDKNGGDYECYFMRHLFAGGYYFALLFVKCGINSRAATKHLFEQLPYAVLYICRY